MPDSPALCLATDLAANPSEVPDTIVVPAHPAGFEDVFIGQKAWWAVKIDKRKLTDVKFVAAYQTRPISAISHFGIVSQFIPLEVKGRYKVLFSKVVKFDVAVRYSRRDICAVQGPRYTSLHRIFRAHSLDDVFRDLPGS